jgi:hypothetical protein
MKRVHSNPDFYNPRQDSPESSPSTPTTVAILPPKVFTAASDAGDGNQYERQFEAPMSDTGSISSSVPALSGRTTLAQSGNAGMTGMHPGDGYESSDFSRRLMALLEAAGNGNADAQYELAEMYGSGMVDDGGMDAARTWLERAADQGHAGAQRELKRLFG